MVSFLKGILSPSRHGWRRSLEENINALSAPKPEFKIEIAAADSYDRMFTEEFTAKWTEDQLLDHALASGRLLLAGRGGGAKTVILEKCAKRALRRRYVPILLSMRSWTQLHAQTWFSLGSRSMKVDYLLRSLSSQVVDTAKLDALPPATVRMLLIDGLNEVDGKSAQDLIFALDEYAATAINTSVIVSDRLVRRDFIQAERWKPCIVLPLALDEVRRQVAEHRFKGPHDKVLSDAEWSLLSSPYFLKSYLKTGELKETRAAELRNWFQKHASLTDAELELAARAAYQVYGSASRSFLLAEFQQIAGAVVVQKLRETLIVSGQQAVFDHHLKHDFLASFYLAQNGSLWNRNSFDHVTFRGSSFDAIMMCVEQIPEPDADNFVRAVYNWNIYGVGHSLAESRRHNVSADMRTVILAMFAERTQDAVAPTAERARDTLRLLQDKDARRFFDASSLSDVFRLVNEYKASSEWFNSWRNLFTTAPGSEVDDAVVRVIEDLDSVQGWTTANVLKRASLNDTQQAYLQGVLNNPDPVIRWRAAHSLGAFPSGGNARALIRQLSDGAWDVRYGAVRSLMELASRAADDLRREVFESLTLNFLQIDEHPSIKEELRRTMLIPRARNPKTWVSSCVDLITAFQLSTSEAEAEKWSRTAQSLFDMFPGATENAN
jgi:hypothetical protein